MLKGEIYEQSTWFEGNQPDWTIIIAQDNYIDSDFFGDDEFRVIGNIFSSEFDSIKSELKHTKIDDLREAILDVNHIEYWDDELALKKMDILLQKIGKPTKVYKVILE